MVKSKQGLSDQQTVSINVIQAVVRVQEEWVREPCVSVHGQQNKPGSGGVENRMSHGEKKTRRKNKTTNTILNGD